MVSTRSIDDTEIWKQSIIRAKSQMPDKAGPLGALLEGTSGHHQWTQTNHPRPTFCNYCREKLSGVPWHGYTCDICKVKAHRKCTEKIIDQCKWTIDASIPQHLQYISPENSIVPHQWVEGNLPMPAKCVVCEKPCGSVRKLQDWRCLWCACCVHSSCLSQLGRGCSLGPSSLSVIPPLALKEVNEEGIAMLREDAYGGECGGGSPLIVLINSKSGDSQGQRIIKKFRRLLNPCQVFDIIATGPEFALTFFSQLESFRVLVCGGDGTVGWVLSAMDKLNLNSKCQLAILPLGTGNDLARVLGWGHAFYDDTELPRVVRTLERAHTKMLDRWSVLAIEGRKADTVRLHEDIIIEKVRAVIESNKAPETIIAVTSLCETIKQLMNSIEETYAKVEEWERQEGRITTDPMTEHCLNLLKKLEKLMKTLECDVSMISESGFETIEENEYENPEENEASRRHDLINRANSLKKALHDVMSMAERGIDQHYRENTAGTRRERFRKKRSKTTPSVLQISNSNLSSSSAFSPSTSPSANRPSVSVDASNEVISIDGNIVTIHPPTPAGTREPSAECEAEISNSKNGSDSSFLNACNSAYVTHSNIEKIKTSLSDSSLYENNGAGRSSIGTLSSSRVTKSWDKLKEHKKACESDIGLSSSSNSRTFGCHHLFSGYAGGSLIAEFLLLNARILGTGIGNDCHRPFDQYKETKVMNNYFGIGLDAKIALEFHNKRDSSDKTRSRSKLFLWYGMLGGKELVHRTYRNLEQRIRLECDGIPIDLPSLQGIVILNIPSYSGGANLWGRSADDGYTFQSFDDKILEVVALFGVIHVATSRVPNVVRLQNHRIAQCRHVRIVILGDEPIPVQVDGEPWLQPPGIMQIVHKNRAQMLASNPVFDATLKKWEEQKERSGTVTAPSTPTILCPPSEKEVPFSQRASEFVRLVETEMVHLSVSSLFLEALDTAAELLQVGGPTEQEQFLGLEDREEVLAAVERVVELLEDHFGWPERVKTHLLGQPRLGPAPHFTFEAHGDDPDNWRYVINSIRQEMYREEAAIREIRRQDLVGTKTKRSRLTEWLSKRFGTRSSAPPYDDVMSWNVDQVVVWLSSIGLPEYSSQFKSNDIQGSELIHLERNDIQELGVKKIGHVKRMQSAIDEIREREVEKRRRNSKRARTVQNIRVDSSRIAIPKTTSLSAERWASSTTSSTADPPSNSVEAVKQTADVGVEAVEREPPSLNSL